MEVINVNVGGTIYSTYLPTLQKYPNSMLGFIFNNLDDFARDKDGNCFINRDGSLFRYVLNFLRTSTLDVPEDFKEMASLRKEAEYYQIGPLIEEIDSRNKRLLEEIDNRNKKLIEEIDNRNIRLIEAIDQRNIKLIEVIDSRNKRPTLSGMSLIVTLFLGDGKHYGHDYSCPQLHLPPCLDKTDRASWDTINNAVLAFRIPVCKRTPLEAMPDHPTYRELVRLQNYFEVMKRTKLSHNGVAMECELLLQALGGKLVAFSKDFTEKPCWQIQKWQFDL